MQFLDSCAEMADMVEEAISGLSGNSRASAFVAMGADGTPTKYIDKVAEDVIFEYLRENEMCANVISEEAGRCEMPAGEGTVIVDPIDGTSNAIRGIPYYVHENFLELFLVRPDFRQIAFYLLAEFNISRFKVAFKDTGYQVDRLP